MEVVIVDIEHWFQSSQILVDCRVGNMFFFFDQLGIGLLLLTGNEFVTEVLFVFDFGWHL